MNKKLKKEKINLEIFEENGKVGIRGKGKDEGKIFVEPIYDYDEALLGSYYVDPEYWENYYLYRFRDGFAIFKKGKKVCVYNENAELVEPLTTNIKEIVEKYYYDLPNYWKNHSL